MVIFHSSAQSVYLTNISAYVHLSTFLILDHTKSHVEKNTLKIRGHQCGAHGHQVAHKDQAGCPQAKA